MNTHASMRPVLLLEAGRKGQSSLRRTTGPSDITWNTLTFVADGLFLRCESIPQPGRYAATNFVFYLNGADPRSQDPYERQVASIYLGYLPLTGTTAVIGDAILMGRGTMNVQDIQESRTERVQPIAVELMWNKGSRAATHARTLEGQHQRFPQDDGLRDVHLQREIQIGGQGVNIFR